MKMTKIRRRTFLAGLGATLALPSTTKLTFAATQPSMQAAGERFVLVILRGAADGIGILPPVGDPDYSNMRGDFAFQKDDVTMLDDVFGLHPALLPLHPWWMSGELVFINAVATQYRERSHFAAQAVLESGHDDPKEVGSGWLGRALARGGNHRALALGGGTPTVLAGAPSVMTWSPGNTVVPPPEFIDRLAAIYDHSDGFGGFGDEMRRSAGLIGSTMSEDRARKADRSAAFSMAGRLLAGDGGPTLAVLSVDGWDTHSVQGLDGGRLGNSLTILADGLSGLRKALGDDLWRGTVVLVVSEFGRTVRMNGNRGTDHGTAGLAMVAGGKVAGRRVIADWPGLAEKDLYQKRDLRPTIDTRAIEMAVLRDHLRFSHSVAVEAFPGMEGVKPLEGLFRA